MATLIPREPYTKEELERLYPKDLQLQLVQVVSLIPHESLLSPIVHNLSAHINEFPHRSFDMVFPLNDTTKLTAERATLTFI
jgi:hypothetical protein